MYFLTSLKFAGLILASIGIITGESLALETSPGIGQSTSKEQLNNENARAEMIDLIELTVPSETETANSDEIISGIKVNQENKLIIETSDSIQLDSKVENDIEDLNSWVNQLIFGKKQLTTDSTLELSAENSKNINTENNLNRSVEIPSGIENIGADMIKLVNQIIFGEKDPTQRLELKPVIDSILEAIDKSPVINKTSVNIQIGEANLKALEQSRGVSVSASGGLNYSYTQNSNGSENSGASVNPTITASRKLYDFGQLDLEIEAEIVKQQIKNLQNEKAQDELFLDAISSFYEVQRALLQTRLARENLASRKAFVSFIRQRMEIGASSSADVIRAEARVAGALGALSSSLESLAVARTNYKSIFGKEAEPYILPRELGLQDLDIESLEAYVRSNPDVALVEMNIKIAELELSNLLAQRKGNINSSLSVRRSYSETSGIVSDSISAGVSYNVSLFDGGISGTKIEQAELNLKNLQFEEQRTKLALNQQIEDAFSQYDGKVAAVSSKMLVLEGAKDSYNITKELYTFSRISLFEVLSAQEELFNSGKNLIDSIIDRALAKYKLLYLCDQFQEVENFGSPS